MTRLGLTLCEMALCTPIHAIESDAQQLMYCYRGLEQSKHEMLADVASDFGGPYANVAKVLLAFREDPNKTVAPFDVVCLTIEECRQQLQDWYDGPYSVHRDRHSNERWRRRLTEEHTQRTIALRQALRTDRALKSRSGQSVSRLRAGALISC